MRLSNRNKQAFWYALYTGTEKGYDDYGNPYGQFQSDFQTSTYASHGNPVKAYGNISPARGAVETRHFGDDLRYDKTIWVEDRDTPITEYTVLWIDRVPSLDTNGALKVNANGEIETPWDYIVRSVGRGLPTFGGAEIAVSKVSVS